MSSLNGLTLTDADIGAEVELRPSASSLPVFGRVGIVAGVASLALGTLRVQFGQQTWDIGLVHLRRVSVIGECRACHAYITRHDLAARETPTIEQIKARLRAALPDYRRLGFEPNAKNVITDIAAEVAKMIEEASS